ncbi:hypothetical protein VNI00_011033 [Paramarasmius palmivorus]|uniref:Lysine-specific metallo-endopeptidase domain-containing protein n=1 Tax=Paramarasmius palmivorus TaxID=297713 RepID=A0AAW0CEJ8_9AGAR
MSPHSSRLPSLVTYFELAMNFSASLRSALVGLCLSAIAASASRSLSLSVTGPESVDGVDNLKVVASLQNTGDETLKILKDPRGVLSTLPTETFGITDVRGVTPGFTGIKVKFVPEYAATLEDSFAILEPGQSVEVEHDLSAAYNFTLPGEGFYDIHADNLFQIVDPATSELTDLRATQETSLQANVKGKLAIARREVPSNGLAKRATYRSCSSTQQSQLAEAATAAANYANGASSYLNALSSGTSRYTTWFGTYATSRKNTVASNFNAIKGYSFSGETYDSNSYGVIYLCGAFWRAPVTGTDSRGGTLIHEASHFTRIAGTSDVVYGQSGAKSLAISNPSSAIRNADSHEYFAENNPALS